MAIPSTMTVLGSEAPPFALPDVTTGAEVRLEDFADRRALLVMFLCRHCPYVDHVREGLALVGDDYADADVGIVAISANDPAEYPEDAPESLAEEARTAGYRFPYLFDETHLIATQQGATRTGYEALTGVSRGCMGQRRAVFAA